MHKAKFIAELQIIFSLQNFIQGKQNKTKQHYTKDHVDSNCTNSKRRKCIRQNSGQDLQLFAAHK